ncbi:LysR substrate-binding domain-containing protein [Bordetella tumulicola]|uniref:LysR substrate-binding domain-containing protein n=1 Tax=Bordetella tumulicola TaxID=1649133 RepID=UPI0039F0F00D
MELRHLRYFLALAERLNFTQAAAQVHVTQSTLSHQISQLEDELGQRLFDRSDRRVTITAAGELFLTKAINALAEIDNGIALMNTLNKDLSGELRIGTTPTLNMEVVPRCIAQFTEDHPSVHILVEEETGDELISGLRAQRLDLVLAYRPLVLEGIVFEPLYTEEMILVVGERHAFARRRRVRMAELHRRELVLPPRKFTTRQQIDEAFTAVGAQPFVVIEMVSLAAILALVEQTALAAIVSRSAWRGRDGLYAIPLEAPTMTRMPGLIWVDGQPRAPAVAAFASIVRGVAKSSARDHLEWSRGKSAPNPRS